MATVAGSLRNKVLVVDDLTSGDITVTDLVVSGTVTLQGTATTLDSTNTTITDSIIELNSGLTGSNTKDIGFVFERGSTGNNAAFIWDESADRFTVITTTGTASDNTLSGTVANFQAGSFFGNGANLTSLNGTNISSGTVAAARIASLAASKITSGTFATARIPNLDASKITSGLIGGARLATGTSGDWWSGNAVKVGTDGVSEVGKYIDFHNADAGTSDYTARITNTGDHLYATGRVYVNASQRVFADDYHPNADKWTTARSHTVTLTGEVTGTASQTVDGTGNKTWSIGTTISDSALDNQYVQVLPRHNADGDSLVVQSKASITIWDVSGASDDPSGASDGLVLSAGWDSSSWGIQQFHDFHSNDLYLRAKNNGSMTSWDRVFHDTYHPNADTWTTARTITLGGDLSGSVSINGSANVTLTATVADDSHNHVLANVDRVALTSSQNLNDYNTQSIISWGSSQPTNSPGGYSTGFVLQDNNQPHQLVQTYGGSANKVKLYGRRKTSGTWDSTWTQYFSDHYHPNADTLTTARTIAGTSFNGSANIDINYNNLTNKPTIPAAVTNNNQLTNGAGYITDGNTNWNNSYGFITSSNSAITNKLPLAGGTMTGTLTLPDTGFSIGNEYHKWKRAYVVNSTSPQEILYRDGNSLPNGGVYRFTAHIDGTGTDQSATAVFWNQNGTWKVNVTGQSGTSSNHPEFIISSSTNKPTIHIDHTSNYTVQILHERIELSEGTGTDNAGFAFGTDGFLGAVGSSLYFTPNGTSNTGANPYDDGQRVFADDYHPNANKWTTARTLSLTGAVTGSVSWDGSGNASIATTATSDPTLTLSGDASGSATFTNLGNATLSVAITNDSHTHAFNNLTGKTSGTNEYSTSGYLTAGRGSGGVSLTHNDGYGNANVTFNHKAGVPEQAGNCGRIVVNTDSTTGAQMNFELLSNSGTAAVNTPSAMEVFETSVRIPGSLMHAGDTDTYLKFDTNRIRLYAGGTVKFDSNNTYLTSGDGNYYLDGITKSGNTLTFSVNGATNQTYTFGSNAFNSTTIPTNNNQLTNGAGYITDGNTNWNNSYGFITSSNSAITNKLPLAGGTMTGAINAGGGINGLTLSNGISGNNFNITGVNQLTINDPGEGIVFGGGSTTMSLAIVDDATDRILRYSGTGAVFDVQGNITLTGTVDGVDIAARNAILTSTTTTANAALPKAGGTMTGDLTIPSKIIHSGDSNTYMQFHAADQWRVVTGGAERLEVNNSAVTVGGALNVGTLKVDGKTVLDLPSNNPERGPWNPIVSSIRNSGRRLYQDEEFSSGTNSVGVYNNAGGGVVSITREAATTNSGGAAPNSSGQVLRVNHNGGTSSPGFGGFIHTIPSEDNHTFVQIFQAKLRTGSNFVIAENAQGSNNTSYWLTETAGTGKWEWYARISHCGNTGTFSSGGHVYVSGGSGNFNWYLASSTVIDVTESAGSVDRTHLAADIIDGTKIANDVINSEHYVHNSIDALHLNVSGNGTTSQYLRSDGDGTMSWVTPPDTTNFVPLAGGTMTGDLTIPNKIIHSGDSNTYMSFDAADSWKLYCGGQKMIQATEASSGYDYVSFGGTDNSGEILFNVSGGDGHFDGDIYAFSTTTSSDRKLKKNIQSLEGSLEKVLDLRGVSFEWKKNNKKSIGFIAQEVQEVVPDLVKNNRKEHDGIVTEEHLGVDYGNITALLVEAVKEQQSLINRLEERIKVLENKNGEE